MGGVLANPFSERPELISQINDHLSDLERWFDDIRSLERLCVNDENFNKAFQCFYSIFSLVPLMTARIGTNTHIFRTRPNDKKNRLFNKLTDISFNSTNTKAIKAGRFNLPNEALFYGSMPVESSKIDSFMVSCLETCKGLTTDNNPVMLKDFTIGKWKISTPLFVVNFCFDEAHMNGNEILKSIRQDYFNTLKRELSDASFGYISKFISYYSNMSGRKSLTYNEYYILTAMFWSIRKYYFRYTGQPVYGLVYPSAATEAKGLNIVLTPEAVQKFLYPDVVAMYRFILDRTDKKTYSAYQCSDVVQINDGQFNLTGFMRIPEERWYTIECESNRGPLKQSKQ